MQQISQTAHGQKVLKKLNEDVSLLNYSIIQPYFPLRFIDKSLVLFFYETFKENFELLLYINYSDRLIG